MRYLNLSELPATHYLLRNFPFAAPVSVGPTLAITDPSPTAIVLLKLVCNHTKALRVCRDCDKVDRAIKLVITNIMTKVYFQKLWNDTYKMLEYEDIQAMEMALKTPKNNETHFGDFVAQIKDNQEAVASQNTNTNKKIVSIAYTLVFKLGFYPLKFKEWRLKVAADKTWNNFKNRFL